MLKIVHIYWQLTFGGIETMLVNIANAQSHMGADVSVIIVNELYAKTLLDSFHAEVNVICLHRKIHCKNPTFVFRLNRVLERLRPDTIHLHDSKLYPLIFSQRLSREACVTLHDLPRGSARRNGFLHRLFPLRVFRQTGNVACLDAIPKVFSISKAVQKALKEIYGIDSTVINNGIRTSDFIARPCRMPNKERLRLVQVGRLLHDKKGQDLLIKAVAGLNGIVEADFIGTGESMEYLQRLAEEMNTEKYVRFLGDVSQQWISEHLCTYDLLVQPSRYDGFGLTVAEAMAACVPVLVSTGQGPAEITCNDEYGWLFENGDIEDLIRAIRHVREHYDVALHKAIQACRYVKATYDVAVTAQKYLQGYVKPDVRG